MKEHEAVKVVQHGVLPPVQLADLAQAELRAQLLLQHSVREVPEVEVGPGAHHPRGARQEGVLVVQPDAGLLPEPRGVVDEEGPHTGLPPPSARSPVRAVQKVAMVPVAVVDQDVQNSGVGQKGVLVPRPHLRLDPVQLPRPLHEVREAALLEGLPIHADLPLPHHSGRNVVHPKQKVELVRHPLGAHPVPTALLALIGPRLEQRLHPLRGLWALQLHQEGLVKEL
mmetsp:Transcript_9812/g.33880  ORF Transcript_9812/g.33880 Transcript_9812/m.33880 type:complete len:226 (-) Transcript_9812:907-1584(-)